MWLFAAPSHALDGLRPTAAQADWVSGARMVVPFVAAPYAVAFAAGAFIGNAASTALKMGLSRFH
jgi:hypothetical protein